MKIKNLIIFVLAVAFVPAFCFSAVPPHVYLTIIVNTEQDATFHYSLSGQFPGYTDIDTQNLVGSGQIIFYTNKTTYTLSQGDVPGLQVNRIVCTSDNAGDSFSYQSDNVTFIPISQERITCTFNNIKGVVRTPVLIVPGLVGTEIFKNSENYGPILRE
jgi:hypothetical protein